MYFTPTSLIFNFHNNIPGLEGDAFTRKLFSAEKNIGFVRLLVVMLHGVAYFFIPLKNPIPYLEYVIIFVSHVYAFYVYFAEPYKKYKILLASLFTTVIDALLISLNIIATGGFESPFFLVWFLALTSVAYRYSYIVTLRTSIAYSAVYFIIMVIDVPFTEHYGEILLRIGYIVIHGYLVGFISRDFLELIVSKLMVEQGQKELQKREMLLNDAQQIAHVGSWEWDLEQNHNSWSDEMYRIYGYTDTVVDISLNTYLGHSHPEDFNSIWNTIISSVEGKTEFDHYFRIIDCKGDVKYIHGVGKPILSEEGEVIRVIGTCYDVTKQKKTEDALRKSQVQLEERVKERTQELNFTNSMLKSEIRIRQEVEERQKELIRKLNVSYEELKRTNEDIDNFVYSASHDLKSPVLNIEALVNLLYTPEEQCDDYEFLSDVKEKLNFSLSRMKDTIENISRIARAQKQALDDVEDIDFTEILNEVIKENEEVIKESGAEIIKNFNSETMVTCSRVCIKSMFYNFITNSIKYRHFARRPVIEISTEFKEGYLCFYVKDNGLGIDLERYRHKMFGIFKRFHDHVEGTGIGLYMVKRMVEKNNGKIDVESIPESGTTFIVTFPLYKGKWKLNNVIESV